MDNQLNKEKKSERIGIFPSWTWLYGAVLAYTAALIALLYVFTITLDLGAQ